MSAVIASTHANGLRAYPPPTLWCSKCSGPAEKAHKRGLCNRCYAKDRLQSMPAATCHPERKEHCGGLCSPCYRAGGRAQRATCHPDRLQVAHGLCRKCYNDLPDNKERAIKRRRLRKYGLTEEQYESLLAKQGWQCAICGGEPKSVDHDHVTGEVRGVLCRPCNTGLGHFKDDPERLRRAATYIEEVAAR